MIDSDDYAASGIVVKWFPGGEMHVELPPKDAPKHVHIYAKLRTWTDVGAFMGVCNAYKNREVRVHAFMPYFPGARQDRVQLGDLTVEMYTEMFSAVLTSVTVADIHSPAALEIIRKRLTCHELPMAPVIRELFKGQTFDIVLAPDAGAVARTLSFAATIGCDRVNHCTKVRDPKTGNLTVQVPKLELRRNESRTRIIIPDDICDGGRTFTSIQEVLLREDTYVDVSLFVTHGIFSQGFEPFFQKVYPFDMIFTTDSFFRELTGIHKSHVKSASLLPHYYETLTP